LWHLADIGNASGSQYLIAPVYAAIKAKTFGFIAVRSDWQTNQYSRLFGLLNTQDEADYSFGDRYFINGDTFKSSADEC
jgi:hypothetical protein